MTQELTPNTQITQENVGSLPWLRGLLEQKLEVACRADHADALFPMDERQAAAYHQTRADLLGWVLDMLPSDSPPLVRIDANTDRPALSPPAEGSGYVLSGNPFGTGLSEPKLVRTPTPAPAEVPFAAEDACLACNSPAQVDWNVVGPKLVEALEGIADEASPYDGTNAPLQVRIAKDLTRRIGIAKAALAATTPQSNGE